MWRMACGQIMDEFHYHMYLSKIKKETKAFASKHTQTENTPCARSYRITSQPASAK